MKITESQISASCQIASQVYSGQFTATDGITLLADKHGLNNSSARGFIYMYKFLMEGRLLKRNTSAYAMNHFIEQIYIEHGTQGLSQALTSLRAYIDYKNVHNAQVNNFQAILKALEARLP